LDTNNHHLTQIKVEIFIPLFYNYDENGNQKEVEYYKFVETIDELIIQFKGCSVNRDIIDGLWISPDSGKRQDNQHRDIWIMCEDTQENLDYLILLKDRLMERFEQEEIFMFYAEVN